MTGKPASTAAESHADGVGEARLPTPATAELRATGAIVPPEVACRCEGICDREDGNPIICRYCRFRIDPVYSPCPRLGFGCGPGCECCTPEQQEAANV